MNRAKDLYDIYGKAFSIRAGVHIHQKQSVEIFLSEMEKLVAEFKDPQKMATLLQEIREDLAKL